MAPASGVVNHHQMLTAVIAGSERSVGSNPTLLNIIFGVLFSVVKKNKGVASIFEQHRTDRNKLK